MDFEKQKYLEINNLLKEYVRVSTNIPTQSILDWHNNRDFWIKIDPNNDVDSIPPPNHYVLYFDESDNKQKVGRLTSLHEDGNYIYEIQGVEFHDINKVLTYWQPLGKNPEEYLIG